MEEECVQKEMSARQHWSHHRDHKEQVEKVKIQPDNYQDHEEYVRLCSHHHSKDTINSSLTTIFFSLNVSKQNATHRNLE
jgi:hypothetical protein